MIGDPCACGCSGVVTSSHPRALYASPQCRKRSWARSHGVHTVVGREASNRRLSGRVNPPGRGVRCYLADDAQAESAYFCLKAAGLVDPVLADAAKRVGRALGRQRVRLEKLDAA